MRKTFVFLIIILTLVACNKFDYHPYDTHIDGDRHINTDCIQRIEQSMQGRKRIRFAVMSDSQRWYDATRTMVRSINAQPDLDFVIHCGDLTDFGMTNEFEWMRNELARLEYPYVAALGNHDCLGTGRDVFKAMYGEFNFSFNAGNTHFLVLNTNGLEFDHISEAPNLAFMAANAATLPDSIERTVVVMHAAPMSDQFGSERWDDYQKALKAYPNVQFSVCGHEHRPAVRYPEEGCIPYYLAGCTEQKMYYVFTLNEDGSYEYKEVWA